MRINSAVTSVSWIPSEAIAGMTKLPFQMGVAHYDQAPPDRIDGREGLAALRDADRFRFSNDLRAWIDVDDDGHVIGHGYEGSGHIGSTSLRLGGHVATFAAVAFPDRRHDPVVGPTSVRFTQTCGGRTGVPAPRRVQYPPFIQVSAPLAWTTLALTISADGISSYEVLGASPFPRHWIYDREGTLVLKSGLVDFKSWYQRAFGEHTPWGDEDSAALVSEVESALERELSGWIMRGAARPTISELRAGSTLVQEGDGGSDIFLLLDGVVSVQAGGADLGHLGPGAVLGERALLEDGRRTATLRAVTACRVAAVDGRSLDPDLLSELAQSHRREESGSTPESTR